MLKGWLERAWLPDSPNVRYIEVHSHKDRVREYLRYPNELDTIEAFNKIADGEYDHVAEQAFFMCGGLDDVEQKWAEIQKSL